MLCNAEGQKLVTRLGLHLNKLKHICFKLFLDCNNTEFHFHQSACFFNPPNSGNIASKRYKSYIDAGVGSKLNSYREPHEDAHYIFARNKYLREFASMFNKSICILSTDDMAKVKVGPPAVLRYHQICCYFLGADTPNMPDHDFLIPGYLLNVSGYMRLEVEKPKIDQSEDTMNIENSSVHDNNQINDQKNS